MHSTLQVYRSSCTTVNRAVNQTWSNQILLFNANPAISPRSFWSEFNLNVFITFNVIIITWWLRTNHYVIDWILILNAFYTSKCSFLKCFKSAKIAASQKTLDSPSSFPILHSVLWTGSYQFEIWPQVKSLDRGQPVSSTCGWDKACYIYFPLIEWPPPTLLDHMASSWLITWMVIWFLVCSILFCKFLNKRT